MPMKTWKRVEQTVAQLVEGQRVGNKGCATEDVTHPLFSIECKHRSQLPTLITDGYAQAERNSPKDRTPLLVLHEKGSRRFLAVLPLDVLMKLLSRIEFESKDSGEPP
jgi:hypothetical protein